jgi:hypothetical protein
MADSRAPTLADVKAWLGLEPADTADDVVLTESLNAALTQQGQVVAYPVDGFGDAAFTPDLREAIYLRTQRLAARRNSPEGIVGLGGTGGDFTAARVPAYDADVAALEAPYRKIPVS